MLRYFPRKYGKAFTRLFSVSGKDPKVPITVDGKKIMATKGAFLIDAIKEAGVDVPSMCYHSDLKSSGGICRICAVEDLTRPNSPPIMSCRTLVQEGMNISTVSEKLRQIRQTNTALMFRTHPTSCLTCSHNTRCETQDQASKMNIFTRGEKDLMYQPPTNTNIDHSCILHKNMDLCIGCDRCIQACSTQVNCYEWYNKGYHQVESFGPMQNSECIQCGQCINRCPTGALTEKSEIPEILSAIGDPNKQVVFQFAPAIRVAIGEEFGLEAGERLIKNELVTALKNLGKNVTVFDTDFAADLTIMEEASEFVERLTRKLTGKKYLSPEENYITELPLFTSCCPGWVTFMEKNYPDMLPHMSTCKSPMGMQSAMIKTYWAKQIKKVDPKNVVVVALMPCNAKKVEKDRPDMRTPDFKWTDHSITTRELAKMLKEAGQDPTKLPKTEVDAVLGDSTGAAVIFGATGGVLEAALRTGYEVITGREVPFKNLDILPVRGMEDIREAKIKLENVKPEFSFLEGVEVRVAVAHKIGTARIVVDMVRAAKLKGEEPPWHLIEVMACPGGCIGGGGQPKPTSLAIRNARSKLIYQEDKDMPRRKSHDNPEVAALYKNFLTHPLSHKAHHLLHREYTPFTDTFVTTFNADEARGIETVLDKYPMKKQEFLLPMIIDENDRKGYISDASLVKIATHVGVNPGRVASILSSYHYFPRKHKSDTNVYLCMCHNCVMRGQMKNHKMLCEMLEQDKTKFSLHKMNWLGTCVNDAPAAMVKRDGTDYVEYLMGINEGNIVEKFGNLSNSLVKMPQNNIKSYPFSRLGHASMIEPMPTDVLNETFKSSLKMKGEEVIAKLKAAKLQGRGGAGFPTFIKWDSVRKMDNKEKYVVCNADEGLPSTFKDWYILIDENARMKMISGMNLCAKVIGAKKAYIYLRYEYRNLVPEINKTIASFAEQHPECKDIHFEVRLGGGPYVAGEETAQFESIQGEAPLPRKNKPWNVFATMQGVFNAPTVINNVETFFSVPYIMQQEGALIEKHGLPKLFGVTGDIEQPVMMEYGLNVEPRPTLEKMISEINALNIEAAEVGGCTEPLTLKKDFNKPIGFAPGCLNAVGSFVLFNSSRDLKEVYLNKLEFMQDESCRQCVPCREGSQVLKESLACMLKGNKPSVSDRVLKQVADTAAISSICAHGKAIGPLFLAAADYLKAHSK